jgi:hypothetical protein
VGGFSADDATGVAIHSQLLVSVAEGGLLGGLFFFVYGAGLLWALTHCTVCEAPHALTAVFLLTITMAIWNLAFSPFSGVHRIWIGIAAGLLVYIHAQAYSFAEEREPEGRLAAC